MEDNTRRRRQNDAPMDPPSDPRYHHSLQNPSQQPRRSYAGSSADRFRPAPLTTSSSATGRGLPSSATYSGGGYYQDTSPNAFSTTPMPQGAMGYHHSADYAQPDTRQTQGFGAGSYNPTAMMYNVQQPGGPQNPAVYDTSQQFPPRQPAAMPLMPTDVAAPYFPGEPSNTPAAPSGMEPQAAPTSQALYQQHPLPSYSGGVAAMGGMTGQHSTAPDVSMQEHEYPASGGLDEAYASYQSALREIFRNIQNGVLAAASDSLLSVSDWLLSHVVELGLNLDDQNLHGDRIKLWNDFNHAWLAMLQRQKDMLQSGQEIQRPQTLIGQDSLEKMGKELVRLCDAVERHGLVDYQYGVWEEEIVSILEECLDQYESPDDVRRSEGGPSSHS